MARARRRPVAAIAGAALLGGSWALVRRAGAEIPPWELRSTAAVNGLPDRLGVAVWPVMQLGNFWVWAVAAPLSAVATRRREPPVAVTAAVLAAWGGAKGVKRLVGRGRPAEHLGDTAVRERGITGHGFVSGHAAIATALATVVTPLVPPRWRPLLPALAAAVGASRIYVGAHLPLDVVGGAGLGLLCGDAAVRVVGLDPVGSAPR